MPSWPVHIALANKLKNKYKFTDDFILGNIMPDATDGFIIKDISTIISHSVTHYNFEGNNRPPKNDIEKFLEVYNQNLENEIIFGSLIHLLTDNYFNEYTLKKHIINMNDKKIAILNDGSRTGEVTPWKLKQSDFRIFGNYLILNKELGNEINQTNQTIDLICDLGYTITQDDIKLIIDKVNSFIVRDVNKSCNLRMFTLEELKKLFNDCYKYLDYTVKKFIKREKILVKRKD